MLFGLDFDNTLISYDRLFQRIALDRKLIPQDTPPKKDAVRDYLRRVGKEDEWTRLQGEVYGSRILEAEPFPGMHDALVGLSRRRIPACIVSHKTRTPYLGEPWDLHVAAHAWLAQQGFFESSGLGWRVDRVFFELTKEAKVARILDLGCTHYVDDLPEILEMLPETVERILFATGEATAHPDWKVMRSWQELGALLDVT